MQSREAVKTDASTPPIPRKRRRRAVGGRATDDCFSCTSSQVKCDRERPYCTQCLEQGRQCSGYKTNLTWGVGVASRGKLRGLLLPVLDAQQNATEAVIVTQPPSGVLPTGSTPPATPMTPHVPEFSSHVTNAAAVSNLGHTPMDVPNQTLHAEKDYGKALSPDSPHGPATLCHPSLTFNGLDNSTHVPAQWYTGKKADCHLSTPNSYSNVPPNVYPSIPNSAGPHASTSYLKYGQLATYTPSTDVANLSKKHHRDEDNEARGDSVDQVISASSSNPSILVGRRQELRSRPHQSYYSTQPFYSQWAGRKPRMRYLIEYYAEVIAPVIVAFDTPTNPFRMYILELAKGSETLQHAIAALSLSNLRQRRKNWGSSPGRTLPTRHSSQAHRRMIDRPGETSGVDDQLREESFHKAMAVKAVNTYLADPLQRRTDSLLATLLVLCMFHMCDTGLASFRNQFAGIKRLLAIRGAGKSTNSNILKWFTRMFTWFDTMTATINNRDSQLNGSLLEVTILGEEEWSLENLSGCDSRLFKMVARLGRITQLSQTKTVDTTVPVERPIPTAIPPPSLIHYPYFRNSKCPDADTDTSPSETPAYHASMDKYQIIDHRVSFWQEWRAIRQRLESWRLGLPDPPVSSPYLSSSAAASSYSNVSPLTHPLSSSVETSSLDTPFPLAHISPTNLRDVSNISESFRYAALLYLERLANPHLPTNHPRIQSFVKTSLHYITAVQSDVFLLWPLFVTGSECYLEEDRTIIRDRCGDIQKDSGFINNISCLELLEKVWKAEGSNNVLESFAAMESASLSTFNDGSTRNNTAITPPVQDRNRVPTGEAAFRWQRIIEAENITEEYIVV